MWKRTAYFSAGSLSLALGIAGLFLPLLPTTPFLLLSSYCYVRSSPTAHYWLIHHPWFGPSIRDWEERHAVRRSVKVLAVLMVGAVVTATWIYRRETLPIPVAVTVLATIGLTVVWWLPVASGRSVLETTLAISPVSCSAGHAARELNTDNQCHVDQEGDEENR